MKKNNRRNTNRHTAVFAVFIVMILGFFLVFACKPNKGQEKETTEIQPPPDLSQQPVAPEPVQEPEPEKPHKRIYMILDDAGNSINQLKPFLEFPGKLTVAVMPGLAHSRDAAVMAHQHGKNVILHQPMEAIGGNDPGPGAVFTSMSSDEIARTVNANLDSIPYVEGMNNHMGSAATSDRRVMETVLKIVRDRNIYFVDSFTHSKSVCTEVAENNGMTIAKRDIFLDNVKDKEKIMEALNQAKSVADRKGYAIMIGHVWSSELADTMMEMYPDFIDEGYCFESASDFFILNDEDGKNF
ncbi:MAG: divergent polysaccharide deacetylase family protein [Spirochaetia bacterium]|nr:divergent polysaccharide deacetylase family protein [Spirochaetia bacterium]